MNVFYRGWEIRGDKRKVLFTATKGNDDKKVTLVDTSAEKLKQTIDRLSHEELRDDGEDK